MRAHRRASRYSQPAMTGLLQGALRSRTACGGTGFAAFRIPARQRA